MGVIEDKANRLDSVPAEFYAALGEFEPSLLDFIRRQMGKLEEKDGRIKPTAGNLKIINSIMLKIKAFMRSERYTDIVSEFGSQFDEQAKLTAKLFEEEFGEFKTNAASKRGFELSKDQSLLLLLGDSLNKPLFSRVESLLINSVTQNALITDLLLSMSTLIVGDDDRLGTLSNYTTTTNNIRDDFSTSDREFTQQSADLQNVEWYFYAGGTIRDTRDFCQARDGKYFHKTEVQLWVTAQQRGAGNPDPSTKWQGQRPSTTSSTIFSVCGGYNCNHALMPVSIFSVPKAAIERNIRAGNYTPTASEIQQLNLAA